jgi:F0F1-type ATP synthase membrane subunit b/b'
LNLINQLIEGLGIDRSFFVIGALYAICYLLIRTFFVKPMTELISGRRDEIESARELHAAAMAKTEAKLDEQRSRLAEARLTARTRREALRKEALDRRAETLGAAKSAAETELTGALAELDSDIATQKADLEKRADDLAERMAGVLLGKAS